MHDPKRNEPQDPEGRTTWPAGVSTKAELQETRDLDAIGGELLDGSGFEAEEPDEEFL